MPRRNRVTPFGEIVASPARGTLMGNRGHLHDDQGVIRRSFLGQRWIICRLSFKGRWRPVMTPGQYTELFFLDEATALAAGHRPCAECQRERFEQFRAIWAAANPRLSGGQRPTATTLDAALHAERLTQPGPMRNQGRKRTYAAPAASLPDGAFVIGPGDPPGQANLVLGQYLLHWTPFGYDTAIPRPIYGNLRVLTPRSVVRTLAAGFEAGVHASAQTLLASRST